MSSISLFDINSVVFPNGKIFLCLPASAAAAAVNPEGIKTLLANGLITVFINIFLFLVIYQEILLIKSS